MPDISKAFDVPEDGIIFSTDGVDKAWIGSGTIDVLVAGLDAPASSIYMRTDTADVYRKDGAGTTDWTIMGDFGSSTDFEGFANTALSTTTSATPQDKLVANTTAKQGGKYYMGFSMDLAHTKKDNGVGTTVDIDTGSGFVNLFMSEASFSTANDFTLRSGFRVLSSLPADPTGYDLRIQFYEVGTGTASIKNVELIMWRIGD